MNNQKEQLRANIVKLGEVVSEILSNPNSTEKEKDKARVFYLEQLGNANKQELQLIEQVKNAQGADLEKAQAELQELRELTEFANAQYNDITEKWGKGSIALTPEQVRDNIIHIMTNISEKMQRGEMITEQYLLELVEGRGTGLNVDEIRRILRANDQNNKQQDMTAYERYLAFNKAYPDMKQSYKSVAEWYKQNKKELPKGVYASENSIGDITYLHNLNFIPKAYGDKNFALRDMEFHDFITGLPMFSAWRNSLSIYKIDEMIFDDMLKTPLPLDTPSDIFKHLPDFCVYIEFPRPVSYEEFDDIPLHPISGKSETQVAGFWAYPIQKTRLLGNRIELNICPHVVNTQHPILIATSIVLKDGLSIGQAFKETFDSYDDTPAKEHCINFDRAILTRYLAILLWLCVDEPDLTNITGEPIPKGGANNYNIHKKSGDFVPPSNPKIYHIGKRLGGEIRQYKERIAHDLKTNKTATKRPHIRRGHWHGYWTGTGQNKQFTPKWVSATFVNG